MHIYKNKKTYSRNSRHARIRSRVSGTALRPRLVVTRSLRAMFAQLIDDISSKTLVSLHSKTIDTNADAGERTGNVATAYLLGKALAEVAKAKGVNSVVFDRAGYAYHGRVKALADGARDGGLIF